jgi:autotransporter translocation and assembly factor TamB
MGGGKVEGSGYLNIENNQLDDLFINFVGKNMNLYPIDRTNFTLNADLNLKYIDKKLFLSGHMDALSCVWKRELDEDVIFNTDPSLSPSASKVMNMLEFDLKLTGSNNIRLDNSFGKAMGKFDLRLTGNTDFPILMGVFESREGEVNFSDKKFDLTKAKIVFNNRFMIDPLINVESECFLKNYRVKFNIKGTASRPKPELLSSPPLPPGDIMTLISVGELFERPTSAELSSRIGTVTTSLLASELTAAIKKRTKKIFGDFLLNIDPNISDIEGVSKSRLIVGKEISKNFLVVVATNLSTQRQQQVVYMQYHLTPSISLIGMKNEEGRYSLDLRFRKRR